MDILFEPLETATLRLKNRFFMAPMGTTFSMDRLIPYFVARARGEVALITTGEISVHESGRAVGGGPGDRELSLETDGDIRILEPLVKAVRENGAKFVAQLNHMGRYSFMPKTAGREAVAPSAVASRYTGYTPRELATGEVDDLVVAEAHVGKALVMKRFHARARGRAGRIEKPFANLTIVVREVQQAQA